MKANANNNDIQSVNINLGGIKLAVNGDMSKVISFNPEDISFAEAFYELINKLDDYQKQYAEKATELEKQARTNKYGVPDNQTESFALYKQLCCDMRKEIDTIFGDGTSAICFGNTNTLDMFAEFFTSITPFVQKSRQLKIEKYTKSNGKAVMK